jgi:hypothetical protein
MKSINSGLVRTIDVKRLARQDDGIKLIVPRPPDCQQVPGRRAIVFPVPTTANEVLEPWLAMQIEIH